MESHETSIRNIISEETACSELEAMQDQQFRIAVHEHQRQAREAMNQAVRESSENYEVMMTHEFQCIQNRN